MKEALDRQTKNVRGVIDIMKIKMKRTAVILGTAAAMLFCTPVMAGWQQDSNGYYYLDGSNRVYSNWLRMANSTGGYTYYYINSNGYMVTGWQKINNVWYYFRSDGVMATGWQEVNGEWYYLDPQNGQMKTGWHNQQENGTTI